MNTKTCKAVWLLGGCVMRLSLIGYLSSMLLCQPGGAVFPLFWHQRPQKPLNLTAQKVLERIAQIEADRGQVEWAVKQMSEIVPVLLNRGVEVDRVLPPPEFFRLRRLATQGQLRQAATGLRIAAKGLLQLLQSSSPAQSGDIVGVVVDEKGEPVSGVRVFVLGLETEAVTDRKGMFRIANVPLGAPRYIVIAEADGFVEGQQGGIEVKADGETRVKLRLLKLTPSRQWLTENLAVKVGYLLARRSSGNVRWPAQDAVLDPSLYPSTVREYLKPSKAINADHSLVQKVAREIISAVPVEHRRSETTVAKAVYEWIVRNIRYDLMKNYPGDSTCGNWQTTFGGWGRNFDEWCYTADEVIKQGRAICIEFERLACALLRALHIPARPAPLGAHPVTQWWVQLPDGSGYWSNFESSRGSSEYRRTGDLSARFPAVPDSAITFWSPDASAPIHMDWDAGRSCLWLEDYGQTLTFEFNPAGLSEAREALRLFAQNGRVMEGSFRYLKRKGRQFGLVAYQVYTRGFVVSLASMAGAKGMVVRFPVFRNGDWVKTLAMQHWTNKPSWVSRVYRQAQRCEQTGEELQWYCIEFKFPQGEK